ncbi:MAG: hypothetical protein OET90_10740, partial [Desulfuromonadales bacterium]|nr:hypothetical protein [Desulfuromonadales bacterium]
LLTQKTAEQVQAKFATVSQAAPVATAEVAAPTEAPTEAPTPAPAKKKALPHELRPAPKKGALFHPDWDLTGLPCKSSGQVIKVWETVYNVQISLEGYAAQYCMAFLVLLQCGKKKNLYLLYRLKQDKHTLVCVPAQPPKDEKALKNKVEEVMSFLRMSGFEMEELSKEHIDGALGSYFIG